MDVEPRDLLGTSRLIDVEPRDNVNVTTSCGQRGGEFQQEGVPNRPQASPYMT